MAARFGTIGITIASVIALTVTPAGCSKKENADGNDSRPNVLLIVIDTLRVDRLGCYGSDLGATPRIDQLASEGVRFERAYSHAPWTLPAFASILTSLYPPQHGAGGRVPDFRRLPGSVRTAAECFREAGFATAEVINVDFLGKSFGMTQGFDDVEFKAYPDNVQVRPAAKTTDAALAWLKSRRRQPFFMMVHYFDPHLVYAPPPPYRRRFAAAEDQHDTSWVFGTRRQIVAYRQGLVRFDEATIRRAEHLYNGEVAYTDHEVGRLLDGLDQLGLASSTITALTADHGEEFLDHGGFEHGHTLYEELVRVPLIIRDATRAPAREVASVVGHVDLVPTLCDLAGVEPDPAFVGQSLVDLMNGETGENHPIAFEGNFWGRPLQGWLQGGYKLILSEARVPALFNLADDPGEKNDLTGVDPERVKQMLEDLELARKKMMIHMRGDGAPVELSPEEFRRLRSLGYTG
ncbi:MAG: sulfatase [Phycisphaerae bacterium]|nr:sulfatase [Phycisphaerae bacterium]